MRRRTEVYLHFKNSVNLQSLKVITFDIKIISFSCQQWQGKRELGAFYCFGPCIAEGGETSKVKLPKKNKILKLPKDDKF